MTQQKLWNEKKWSRKVDFFKARAHIIPISSAKHWTNLFKEWILFVHLTLNEYGPICIQIVCYVIISMVWNDECRKTPTIVMVNTEHMIVPDITVCKRAMANNLNIFLIKWILVFMCLLWEYIVVSLLANMPVVRLAVR